ncbi:hypothetical protein EV189_3546 [Motilibacter rhizosphaerae]|uniref:CAAX prenyl protease 2/Lysostaphin resistance protein A-like domain-containing protein n=1 Tax=Motilibacter rhizosphaerae TaxID=598652 RepID=A0A4Q7NAY1_9ACTN|nr:CPBP family glutamic-type intramembrane protease [Motilibacter rhizosphaerae]RZS80066.1 hypothetical protein EV189_3546 [Motilibacter rhizosphaerae]
MTAPSRRTAYAVLGLLYLVGWGPGLVSALLVAAHARERGTIGPAAAALGAVQLLATGAAVLALVGCLARLSGLGLAELGLAPAPRGRRVRDLDCALAYLTALLLGGVLMGLAGSSGYPYGGAWYALPTLVSSALAGPTEELALLALPALLLRRAGEPPWRAGLVLVLVRLSFHVYYGLPVLGLLPWAVTAFVLVWRTGRVLPLVVAHSAWDLLSLGAHWSLLVRAVFELLVLAVLVLALGRGTLRLVRRRRPQAEDTTTSTAPSSPAATSGSSASTMQNRWPSRSRSTV